MGFLGKPAVSAGGGLQSVGARGGVPPVSRRMSGGVPPPSASTSPQGGQQYPGKNWVAPAPNRYPVNTPSTGPYGPPFAPQRRIETDVPTPGPVGGVPPPMATPPPGFGNYGSGGDVMDWMNDPAEKARRMAAKGYLAGQWDVPTPGGPGAPGKGPGLQGPTPTKGLPAQPNGQTSWY